MLGDCPFNLANILSRDAKDEVFILFRGNEVDISLDSSDEINCFPEDNIAFIISSGFEDDLTVEESIFPEDNIVFIISFGFEDDF